MKSFLITFSVASIRVSLHFSISHLGKIMWSKYKKSYKSLPEHAIVDGPGDASHGVGSLLASLRIWDSDFTKKFVSYTWPLITHSVPTLILGLQNALIKANASTCRAPATFPG